MVLLEQEATLRANYTGLALVFAEKADRQEVWRHATEGWDMQRSTIANEWRQEGMDKGIEKGREEGLAALRETVGRIVTARYQQALPADLG